MSVSDPVPYNEMGTAALPGVCHLYTTAVAAVAEVINDVVNDLLF